MNADRLLKLYDKVAEAPDAIERLSRFVLDLAVRGRLVEQNPADKAPTALLAQARQDLEALAATKKRIRWKQTEPVLDEELDKDVPSHWVAARVNDTGIYVNGLAFKPGDWKQSGIPIIRIQNLTDPKKEFNYTEGDFPAEVMVHDGDLLVSWSATLEAFKWERGEGVLNQHIFRVIPHEDLTDRDFLLLLLRHAIREMADSEHAHGLVMRHINRGPFLNHIILIPPLAEQRRIVARVEELMALLDRLAAARTARENTRDRLTTASLARLTASDTDPEEFPDHARFALDALPALTARPDQIKVLRQAILNLAVSGRLVQQESADEPASELLKRIGSEKVRLEKAGEIKRQKSLPAVDAEPFGIPASWRWVRLGELGTTQTGSTPPKSRKDYYGSDVPFIRPGDLYSDRVDYSGDGLSCSGAQASGRLVPGGSVLMVCIGTVGKCQIVDRPVSFNQQINTLTPFDGIVSRYVLLTLQSDYFQALAWAASARTTIAILNKGNWEKLPLPLPPLAEQHRIVAKVDALRSLSDRLEALLSTANTSRARLLEAVLHETLEASSSQREAA